MIASGRGLGEGPRAADFLTAHQTTLAGDRFHGAAALDKPRNFARQVPRKVYSARYPYQTGKRRSLLHP